jgi:hypothetical protein
MPHEGTGAIMFFDVDIDVDIDIALRLAPC